MAKTVTFTDLATPTGLAGVKSAGGSLLASTTYYYRVVAVFGTGTSTANEFYGKSLASNEISVTTDASNKSVTLTWNHPKGAGGGYRIYRATASGAYLACINDATNQRDSVINSGGVCTYIDSGIANAGNNAFQNTSHGKLTLAGSTSGDVFSIVDLYNADVANGWGVVTRLDPSTYKVEAYIVGHSSMYWVDEEKTIVFMDGISPGSGSNYRFGRLTGLITNRGCFLIFKVYFLNGTTFPTLNAYKTIFQGIQDYNPLWNTYSGLSFTELYFNNGTVQDCQASKLRAFAPQISNSTIKNFIGTEADILLSTGQGTLSNVTGMGCSRIFQASANAVIRAKDVVSVSNTYTILIIGTNGNITMVNTNVAASSYQPQGDATGTVVNELFTYNLTVYKNDGVTPISGATVKIYDAFNNLICNTTTDSAGKIAEQELIFRKQTYVVAVRTSTDYAPHKLVVSKDGYETYTDFKAYSGASATLHVVGLKPVVKNRTTIEGKILRAIAPETGSSAKLLEL